MSTRSQPGISRPRIWTTYAGVVATSSSDCMGSTRTIRPPWPLAATAMFPATRNARPPNIFCSVRPGSPATRFRTRLAESSS